MAVAKKYKQCCLKAKDVHGSDRSQAVPKAIQWLLTKYGQIAREALHEGFFIGLDEDECAMLQNLPGDSYEGIMFNAMEWFLADGVMTIKGQDHRVADLLLDRGGPLFSAEQRQWIELLTIMPLRLYEVVEVMPGESMTLRDVMLPERPPVLVGKNPDHGKRIHTTSLRHVSCQLKIISNYLELCMPSPAIEAGTC